MPDDSKAAVAPTVSQASEVSDSVVAPVLVKSDSTDPTAQPSGPDAPGKPPVEGVAATMMGVSDHVGASRIVGAAEITSGAATPMIPVSRAASSPAPAEGGLPLGPAVAVSSAPQTGADGAGHGAGRRGDAQSGASSWERTTPYAGRAIASPWPSSSAGGSLQQALEGAGASVAGTSRVLAAQAIPAPAGGVDMQEMIDSVRATVELAVSQGNTRARIALQPEELGGIRIHLSQTTSGLLARLMGDTPAAAQALTEGRAELRQSLSSLGLPLLRMEIGSYAQPDARPREDRSAARPDGSNDGRHSSPDHDEVEQPKATLGLDRAQHGGALIDRRLVDVLA